MREPTDEETEYCDVDDDLYAVLMSHSEFYDLVIVPYIFFVKKHVHAHSSFINDRLREYCNENNIKYECAAGIGCVKMMDEYVRKEIWLGNY